jgi:hypothetical protein
VFVDEAGHRGRIVGRIGVVLTVLVCAYLLLLGASLVQAPWVPHFALPGLGQVLPNHTAALPPSLGPHAVVTPTPVFAPSQQRSPARPTPTTSTTVTRAVTPAKGAPTTATALSTPTTTPLTTTLPGRGRSRSPTSTTTTSTTVHRGRR